MLPLSGSCTCSAGQDVVAAVAPSQAEHALGMVAFSVAAKVMYTMARKHVPGAPMVESHV